MHVGEIVQNIVKETDFKWERIFFPRCLPRYGHNNEGFV